MPKYQNGCACNYNVINGNSLDLEVNYCESEIRADIVVSEYSGVRLWGRVVNCGGDPVSGALVKLLKVERKHKQVCYTGVAHTISDCEGFYQFELCGDEKDRECVYKVLVSKAAYGSEKVIPTSELNCKVCCEKDYRSECEKCDNYEKQEYYDAMEEFEELDEYPPIITAPQEPQEHNQYEDYESFVRQRDKEYEKINSPYRPRNRANK